MSLHCRIQKCCLGSVVGIIVSHRSRVSCDSAPGLITPDSSRWGCVGAFIPNPTSTMYFLPLANVAILTMCDLHRENSPILVSKIYISNYRWCGFWFDFPAPWKEDEDEERGMAIYQPLKPPPGKCITSLLTLPPRAIYSETKSSAREFQKEDCFPRNNRHAAAWRSWRIYISSGSRLTTDIYSH